MGPENIPINTTVKIDSKDVAGPIMKLINTVSKGIGKLINPYLIKSEAKARAAANIVLAESDNIIKIMNEETQQKLFSSREEFLNNRRSVNNFKVINQSLQYLPENVDNTPVDEDWIIDFFNKSQDISNEMMQQIWAQILTKEVTKPGSFSLRTLNVVKMMNKNDAELFSFVSNFFVKLDSNYMFLSSIDSKSKLMMEFYKKNQVYRNKIIQLENLGLLNPRLNLFSIESLRNVSVEYFSNKFELINKSQDILFLESNLLTDIGIELYEICGSNESKEFISLVIKEFIIKGFIEKETATSANKTM